MNSNLLYLKEKKEHTHLGMSIAIYNDFLKPDIYNVPLHWHDELEITYIQSGSCEFIINLIPYVAHTGSFVIISPNDMHSAKALSQKGCQCETIVFNVNMLKSMSMDIANANFITPLMNHSNRLIPLITPDLNGYDPLFQCVQHIFDIIKVTDSLYPLRIKSAVSNLLLTLYLHQFVIKDAPVLTNKKMNAVRDVINYMQSHFRSPLTLHDLAKQTGYSDCHFSRIFKETTQTTPIQYLLFFRLEYAANTLKTTDDSVLTIAYDSGFNHLSYFIKCFKNQYGVSPKQYQKKTRIAFDKPN